MHIYHALINALSAHMIHITLNMTFYTHVDHSPTKTTHTKTYGVKLEASSFGKSIFSGTNISIMKNCITAKREAILSLQG